MLWSGYTDSHHNTHTLFVMKHHRFYCIDSPGCYSSKYKLTVTRQWSRWQILSLPMYTNTTAWRFIICVFSWVLVFQPVLHTFRLQNVCIRDEAKNNFHYLEETFHATVVFLILLFSPDELLLWRRCKYRMCHCVLIVYVYVFVCVRVCYIEIAGCHAGSHPMISDINYRRGPALSHTDSQRPTI